MAGDVRHRIRRTELAVTQPSDTPTSQSAATRWTFYRRLGLLMRTRLDDDGTTLSLHDIAARTHGRISPEQLTDLLATRDEADPVTCVLLAQAFDVDPDFFVTDEAIDDYTTGIRSRFATLDDGAVSGLSLQRQALALVMASNRDEVAALS